MKIHQDFSYQMLTVLATETLDCATIAKGARIRFIQPVGIIAQINAREFGDENSKKSAYSTTGLYTGADAQCADCDGKSVYNFDKIYVKTGSVPVRVGIVTDEIL